MRIALVNYRYFVDGGPGRYMFNIKEILESHGHEVVTFSIKHPKNEYSEYEDFFLESVDDEEYFSNTKKTPGNILKSFGRMFYSFEAKRKFKKLLDATKPDVVYVLQFHNKISPSVLYAARESGVPVVHRISDFQYMCPNALFYNEEKGLCTDCLEGHLMSCVRHKCVLDSRLYSAIKALAKWFHDRLDITKLVSQYVVPSTFTLGKLHEFGISKEKLNHVPTFFNLKPRDDEPVYEPFFLYVGRLVPHKGLGTLIDAFVGTDYKLKIIGFASDDYEAELKNRLEGKKHSIEFLGRMTFNEIAPYLNTCLCTISPAEWYENFPNAILESFAFKKAVITTAIGSLVEMVENMKTGMQFAYRDAADLRRCVKYMVEHPDEAERMGRNAYANLVERFSPELHYQQLMKIFESAVNAPES